jgi:hypothetical protein
MAVNISFMLQPLYQLGESPPDIGWLSSKDSLEIVS